MKHDLKLRKGQSIKAYKDFKIWLEKKLKGKDIKYEEKGSVYEYDYEYDQGESAYNITLFSRLRSGEDERDRSERDLAFYWSALYNFGKEREPQEKNIKEYIKEWKETVEDFIEDEAGWRNYEKM